jgi:hypothetical protein
MEAALAEERSRVLGLQSAMESLTQTLSDVKKSRLLYKNQSSVHYQQFKELEVNQLCYAFPFPLYVLEHLHSYFLYIMLDVESTGLKHIYE